MTDNRDSFPPIAERVAAGMELLDRKLPGWYEQIDVDRLNLSSCLKCVLGQLFGEYGDGLERLPLTEWEATRLGFDTGLGEPMSAYDELTLAWAAAIRARRQAVTG